ncbi:MAG: hypothetical protein AAGI30_07640 [Planctomycetota bacterium]
MMPVIAVIDFEYSLFLLMRLSLFVFGMALIVIVARKTIKDDNCSLKHIVLLSLSTILIFLSIFADRSGQVEAGFFKIRFDTHSSLHGADLPGITVPAEGSVVFASRPFYGLEEPVSHYSVGWDPSFGNVSGELLSQFTSPSGFDEGAKRDIFAGMRVSLRGVAHDLGYSPYVANTESSDMRPGSRIPTGRGRFVQYEPLPISFGSIGILESNGEFEVVDNILSRRVDPWEFLFDEERRGEQGGALVFAEVPAPPPIDLDDYGLILQLNDVYELQIRSAVAEYELSGRAARLLSVGGSAYLFDSMLVADIVLTGDDLPDTASLNLGTYIIGVRLTNFVVQQ